MGAAADAANATAEDFALAFNDALPLISDQQVIFQQLMDSIAYCAELGSSAWCVTKLDNGFRLNVGQVEAMTWHFSAVPGAVFGTDKDQYFSDIRLLVRACQMRPRSDELSIDSTEHLAARHLD